MRALGLTCALLAAACATDRCKQGTVFVSYTLSGGAESADTIDVTLTIADGAPQTTSAHRRGGANGSIEVDFASYPSGQPLTFTLTARAAGAALASSTQTINAAPGCTSLSFTLDGGVADLAGVESTDLGGSDAAAADLSGAADLALPTGDMVFVPANLPSCTNLAANCGSAGTDNCCASPGVSGGTFYRGYDVAGDTASGNMTYPATISDFRLDKYEVTVGRFRKFLNAGMGTQANPPAAGAGANPYLAGSGWNASWTPNLVADTASLVAAVKCNATYQTWTDSASLNEKRPMNCVTWYDAFAFCAWDGGFLPTQAEWNYAAAGGSEQRAYPWSNPASSTTIDCSYANYDINGSTMYCVNGTTGATSDVGSTPKGDGKWGHSDLVGNLFEFNLDWFNTYGLPCNDCADVTDSVTNRVIHGGSFISTAAGGRTGARSAFSPTQRSYNMGFRCARRP